MPPVARLQAALLDLQRRRLALTAACAAPRTAAGCQRQARAILLAYLRLRRSRLAAQALCQGARPRQLPLRATANDRDL